VNPVFLKYPMAPMMSARLSGKRVNMHPVWKSFRHMQATYDFTIVEGVGGIMVPVKKDYAVLDMIHEFKLPVLVVARPNLGTINHTLLTIDKLRREKITIAGVILSCRQSSTLAEKTNPELIRELTGLPVHEVPCEKNITLRQIETLIRPEILGLRSEK
jgi:dethiobiotin synthetase